MADELKVKVRIDGDGSSLHKELNTSEAELRDFDKVASQIRILETAVADVETLQESLGAAKARVLQLRAALSEAYAADADAPQLKKLNRDLAAAEREATKAAEALKRSQIAVRELDLASTKTGISTKNLAEKKAQLAVESDKVRVKIDQLKNSLAEATIAERNLAAGAATVSNAFATLNIRSAQQIKADIESVNQALVRLASNSKVSGAEFDRAYAGGQVRLAALRAELAGVDAAAGKTSTVVTGLGASLKGLVPGLAGIAIAQQFITANVAAESLERTLVQLTGSGEAAAAEVDYLKATANRLGLSVNDASRAYIGLTAAAKGTSLEGAGTRQVFEAVAGSMAKLGKSSADTEGALLAVTQMLSKGVVSMEEWRQQLGERVPGAAKATADAAGLTTTQLDKMIESGKVLSADLLPLLAVGLEKTFGTAGKAEGSVAAWNRLKNAVSETYVMLGNSGLWQGTITALGWANEIVRGLSGAFELLGKSIGITLAALVNFDFSRPIESVRNWKAAVIDAGDEIEARQKKIAGAAAEANAEQEKQAQDEKRRTAETAEAAAMKLKLQAAYEGLEESAKASVEQAVKSAAAREAEGKASVDLTNALGTESDKRIAALNAAKTDADALLGVSDARRNAAGVALAYADSLRALAGDESKWTDAKRAAIAEAQKAADLSKADAEKAAAESVRAQLRAAQLATETELLKDNSGRLVELKAAADAASVALENMRKLKEQGVATDQQVADAAIKAGQATALYRDALNDQTKAIEYNARLKQADFDLRTSGIKLEIEQARTVAEVAKAYGDEATAAAYLVKVKQLEAELSALNARAKRAEGEAALAVVASKRAELSASGALTVEKERELKAQELAAQVKLKEAEIAGETAERLQQLADAAAASGDSATRAAGDYDKLADSLRGVESAADGASNGVRNVSGSSLGKMGGQSQADFTETLYRRGGTVDEVRLAQKYVGELYARNQATMLTGNLGTDANASLMMQRAINDAVDQALAAARKEKATGQAVDLGVSVDDLKTRNLSKTPLRSLDDMIARIKNAGNEAKQQVVRVDLRTNGGKSSVNVASPQDASSLISTLKELQGRTA